MTAATLPELKTALEGEMAELDRLVDSYGVKIDGGNVAIDPELATVYRKHLANAHEIKGFIEDAEGHAELKRFAAAPAGQSVSSAAAAAAAGFSTGEMRELKTLAEMFVGSDEYKEFRKSGGDRMLTPWTLDTSDISGGLGNMGQKDVYMGSGPTYTSRGFGSVQLDPMVPRMTRKARVRDLFPVAGTSANLIEFFRVTGFGANRLDLATSASMVADYAGSAFGLKPHSNLKFEIDQAPVRTLAHWEAAHRNVLDDEPQLRATIDNELLYGLRLLEDAQIINGTGTGEDLRGILNTPNIQTYVQGTAPNGSETALDAVRRALTKAILAYYEPTGVVVHPYDWETLELSKDSQLRYILATNVAIGAQQSVWRQPVVDTPAMPQKTFLTGAFGLGAQLYDRMQASIRIADQHSDFFVRNAIVILAEERLALAVKRPEAFVRGTFS